VGTSLIDHVWTAPGWQGKASLAAMVGAATCSACLRGTRDAFFHEFSLKRHVSIDHKVLSHSADSVTLPAGDGSFVYTDRRGLVSLAGRRTTEFAISMTVSTTVELGAVSQPVSAPLTRVAIFLVVTINSGPHNRAAVRSFCADLSALIRAVDFRDLEAGLSCVMGIGSGAWDRLFGNPRPTELHPFREIRAGSRHAVSTPGDLLFHIRAKRMDLCFEMATQIMARLGDAVSVVDEVHGFRYFDDRDLLGFVDGTENPRGEAVITAALVGEEDAAFAGGSYVIVQKYLHDLDGWNGLSTEAQERIIGRTKLSDIELDDSIKPTSAHNALTTITENGKEFQIVRDNMPFGRAGNSEFGTYFIGYCRTPRVTEQMIENMFVGRPPGNYDRLLDFSRAVTGTLFFVPSVTFLDAANDGEPIAAKPDVSIVEASTTSTGDRSLRVGSLKKENRYE
jgi:putative iron-dependent peroxidase